MRNDAFTRRDWMSLVGCATASFAASTAICEIAPPKSLAHVIGMTTGSLQHQLDTGVLNAMTLPRFFRDDLGMEMIDFNTRWLTSYDVAYLTDVRAAANDAGCYFSLLKVNHQFGKYDEPNVEIRQRTVATAKKMIDAAYSLGAKWIRFPFSKAILVAKSVEKTVAIELGKYGIERGVRMVIENNAWMKSEADSVQRIVAAIGTDLVSPAPDTGNWDDDVRYEGLAKSFPNAATCDFKVWELDSAGEHTRYDIRRCFEVGWQAGFRGPWAIEHWNNDLKEFARETNVLRSKLEAWTKEMQ